MDGVYNIYKEAGWTSFDVVAKMRGILHIKKIGHTGTLDPNATGVLPVCVGKYTKLVEKIAGDDKEYVAVMLLGVRTDTQDMTGTVIEPSANEDDQGSIADVKGSIADVQDMTGIHNMACTVKDVGSITENEVREAIASFVGGYDQVPPMYSAKKVGGKKLVDLARKGIEVERKPRFVSISAIAVEEMNLPRVKMRVTCGKGTYIRTLCSDIGDKLGCGACMESLVRTRVGIYRIEKAITLDELQRLSDENCLEKIATQPSF